MSLVPYRVSGAAADQRTDSRLFQIGGHDISIQQKPHASGALQGLVKAGRPADTIGEGTPKGEQLENVGFVVWQSAFVLAEYLLRMPPFGQWGDVKTVDLGTGTGVVGIALALAGADSVLTDLPHITPLTLQNVSQNCNPARHRCKVLDYAWGSDLPEACQEQPDIITGADVIYEEQHFAALLKSIYQLSASHTLTYLAFRIRGRGEEKFTSMLEESGFAVQLIPTSYLHEEYRSGEYRILRVCRVDPASGGIAEEESDVKSKIHDADT